MKEGRKIKTKTDGGKGEKNYQVKERKKFKKMK